ncbi:MAG: hypothetical protein ABSD59_14345 [Terracidiphilus sp.]
MGRFSHADAGKIHLYLNYAREHWMKEGENPPVGLTVCGTGYRGSSLCARQSAPIKFSLLNIRWCFLMKRQSRMN